QTGGMSSAVSAKATDVVQASMTSVVGGIPTRHPGLGDASVVEAVSAPPSVKPNAPTTPATPSALHPQHHHGAPTIAGYEIVKELGRGGMGVVYKAKQPGLNRLVALKMILSGKGSKKERDLFRQEAEVIAKLHHPNIVQIFQIGEHDNRPFFSLEFVEGGS